MTDKAIEKRDGDIETIVGPSVKVEGDLNSDGNIVIEGQVNGKIKTSKHLRVEEGAKISADVSADSALVAGEMRGNIKLASVLELTPTAHIYGDVTTKTLIMASGAILHGHCTMDENEKGRKVVSKKGEGYDGSIVNPV